MDQRDTHGLIAPNISHVEDAVRKLVEAFDPLQIIAFGSFARGDEHPGSDLDLLVVLPEVENRQEAAIAMRNELRTLTVPKDIVVATPQEIEKRKDSFWHIIGIALQEGKVVYQIASSYETGD